jgi:hypothetical protein
MWHQNSADILGEAEAGDYLGSSVAAGNFNGDRLSDLAIGAYSDKLISGIEAGAVNALYGAPNLLPLPAVHLLLLNKDQ